MMHLFKKFLGLSWREKRCLLVAFLVLHVIRIGLWQLSFKTLWLRIQSHSEHSARWVRVLFPVPPPIAEWVKALDAASWYTLKPARCLSRALTLYMLMKWFNYAPILRIGVAKSDAIATNANTAVTAPLPGIEAHAWIEYQDQVILGQIRDLERFTPLPSIEQLG